MQVMDASEMASDGDMEFKPSRFAVMVHAAKQFIRTFFDQNPLSQVGIIMLKHGRSEILSPLSASPVTTVICACGDLLSLGATRRRT